MATRDREQHASHHPTPGIYVSVFVALLLLLAVTVVGAEINLGRFNLLFAVTVASVKAGLIAIFFMHLGYSKTLIRLVAASSLYWLAILMGLTLLDYFTREK